MRDVSPSQRLLQSAKSQRSTSPGCDQLSPSCSPVAQNRAAVFIYFNTYCILYFVEYQTRREIGERRFALSGASSVCEIAD